MAKRIGWIGLALCCLAGVARASAGCVAERDMAAAPGPMVRVAPGAEVAKAKLLALVGIRNRIRAVAGTRPGLLVCDLGQVNALAAAAGDDLLVVFDYRMADGFDEDMLASVMGHEFAHLQMKHGLRKVIGVRSLAADALVRLLRQSGGAAVPPADMARELARLRAEALGLDRALELEADDVGFKLMVDAGFDPEAAARTGKRLLALGGKGITDYSSDHPGWTERIDKFDAQALDRRYGVVAERRVSARDWRGLDAWAAQWTASRPASGPAWYYAGLARRHQPSPRARAVDAFAEAVRLDPNNGKAWLELCVELYAEGDKLESAQCSRNLKYAHLAADYRRRTFGDRLAVSGRDRPVASLLYLGRGADGSRLITDDPALIASGESTDPAPRQRGSR